MDMLKCCLNPKVLIGLGVAAVGILVFQPHLFWSALPTLAVLICPLSMGLMMFGMGKMGGMNNQGAQMAQQGALVGAGTQYTCPMHPEVRSDQPGKCPKCGMNLVAAAPPKQARAVLAGGTMVALSREEELARLRAQLDSVREQQDVLARQVEELDAEPVPSSRAIREAEQVARATGGASKRK
ncbi:MAG: heavy metal-binding domain-containing protein [Chloroflexota bacterium]